MNFINIEKQNHRVKKKVFLCVFVSLCLILFITNSISQETKTSQINKAKEILNDRGEVVLKFTKPSNISLSQLSKMISIDKVKHDTIYGYLNRREFEVFLKFGIDFIVIEPPLVQMTLKSIGSVWNWNQYPTYSEYVSMMDSFAQTYPSLCKIINAGSSVKGHSIIFARISSDTTKIKPAVMYSSSMHGNELGGYVMMLRFIDFLLTNYNLNSEVKTLVDSLDIWINPLANPDGAYKGGDNTVFLSTRLNADSVDLNRNFPDPVMGDHPDGNSYQPETNAMMNLMNKYHFILSANFHAGDEVVNYPWDSSPTMHPDSMWFRYISQEYADSAHTYGRPGYFTEVDPSGIIDGYAWYAVYGGRQDYMTYFHHGREVTIELDVTKMTPENELNNLWNYNYRSFLHYLEQGMYGVRGTITDSISHNAIKAEIELIDHDNDSSVICSDSLSGKYYRLINTGTYNIRFLSPGYYIKEIQNVAVNNRQITWLDVALKPWNESVSTQKSELNISLFPNPCTHFLNIRSSENSITNAGIIIYDVTGKIILSLEKFDLNSQLDLSNLQTGTYFLQFKTSAANCQKVLVVKH